MTLIDSSAWIEYLRDTGSDVCEQVDGLAHGEFTTCDPVRLELLAGARNDRHLRELQGLLAAGLSVAAESADWDHAAQLYRQCRRNGETVRRTIDCLIAAIAIRHGLALLHNDADFDVLARHTALVVAGTTPEPARDATA